MKSSTTCAAPVRALLSEAAALRLRGDHGAAAALESDALRVMRGSLAAKPVEVRQ